MRFCTTHRACESAKDSDADDDLCEVAVIWWDHTSQIPKPCSLVDALIVGKVDGEWPWVLLETIWTHSGGSAEGLLRGFDALVHAAKETR